mgnify:FL=1
MHDEDKMIKKLEEHRDLKLLIIEIAEANGITVTATENNDSSGDFVYNTDEQDMLIQALDKYIGDKKA